ncbi:MAG: hypothetical protein JHC98_06000 [Thermoleophilaceae bacterium]|nr:hypothetical protein [Thermoleophilaceae bacterium]
MKVVSEEGADSGLLLAVADEIRPTDASGHGGEDSKWESVPLLHLRPAELDGLLWRVDLTGSWPMLEYEESVPDNRLEHFVRGQLFRSLVLPEVVRQILTKLVVEEKDLEHDEGTWQAGWIDLGGEWAGDDPPADKDDEAMIGWVEDAVRGFARATKAKLGFILSVTGETK